MAMWEQVLLGIAGFILVFLFWPGAKAAMERSKAVENPDWKGALFPLGLVVLFVILLVVISKG
jgi:cytochrome c oxidase assembly factor CtaG